MRTKNIPDQKRSVWKNKCITCSLRRKIYRRSHFLIVRLEINLGCEVQGFSQEPLWHAEVLVASRKCQAPKSISYLQALFKNMLQSSGKVKLSEHETGTYLKANRRSHEILHTLPNNHHLLTVVSDSQQVETGWLELR